MKIECNNCGYTGDHDGDTCAVCLGSISTKQPDRAAIYRRVFDLIDQVESLLEIAGHFRHCVDCAYGSDCLEGQAHMEKMDGMLYAQQ